MLLFCFHIMAMFSLGCKRDFKSCLLFSSIPRLLSLFFLAHFFFNTNEHIFRISKLRCDERVYTSKTMGSVNPSMVSTDRRLLLSSRRWSIHNIHAIMYKYIAPASFRSADNVQRTVWRWTKERARFIPCKCRCVPQ